MSIILAEKRNKNRTSVSNKIGSVGDRTRGCRRDTSAVATMKVRKRKERTTTKKNKGKTGKTHAEMHYCISCADSKQQWNKQAPRERFYSPAYALYSPHSSRTHPGDVKAKIAITQKKKE